MFSSFFSLLSCCASNKETSDGGATRVKITGILAKSGLLCFSNSLIHDSKESLDDVPVTMFYNIINCLITKLFKTKTL